VLNPVDGIPGILVGSYANVKTTTSLFVCASLFGSVIFLIILLQFKPKGRRSQ
jgi:hypothetical protein